MSGVTLNTVAVMLVKYTVFIMVIYLCVLFPVYTAALFVGYLTFSVIFALCSSEKEENDNASS